MKQEINHFYKVKASIKHPDNFVEHLEPLRELIKIYTILYGSGVLTNLLEAEYKLLELKLSLNELF